MSLYSMSPLLKAAEEHSAAVGAFSVSNLEMIRGVMRAAEETETPVILQIAEVRLPHAPLNLIGPAMLAAARQAKVPVAVHLDHGTTFSCIQQALDLGFTSVMFDGSALSMEENMLATRRVIELARPRGATVEAEIGVIGKTESGEDRTAVCASPEESLRFLKETQVDALAVAIGNAHGVYVGAPQLRFDILEAIRRESKAPLVLHGGTGISDEDFRRCVKNGIRKINIATATHIAAFEAAQGARSYYDMSDRMEEAAYQVAKRHIGVFGTFAL